MSTSKKESVSLAERIEKLGYDRNTAKRFALRIGDTPTRDEDGNVLVVEDNNVIARLPLVGTRF
jgi:hypothetical protein